MIRRYGWHGVLTNSRHGVEPPAYLRYQPYQFTHLARRFRKRSYRSGLRVSPPRSLAECPGLIKKLAQKVYSPNGSVDVEDLVQIGEVVLQEGLQDLHARAIRPGAGALKAVLERVQHAMFHAIDQRLVPFVSGPTPDGREGSGDEGQELTRRLFKLGYSSRACQHPQKEFHGPGGAFSHWNSEDSQDCFPGVPGAECNCTVYRQGSHWYFFPTCCASWGAPLPPGSCQPRPGLLCRFPRHLPLVGWPREGRSAGY